jgi:hypothetical protein
LSGTEFNQELYKVFGSKNQKNKDKGKPGVVMVEKVVNLYIAILKPTGRRRELLQPHDMAGFVMFGETWLFADYLKALKSLPGEDVFPLRMLAYDNGTIPYDEHGREKELPIFERLVDDDGNRVPVPPCFPLSFADKSGRENTFLWYLTITGKDGTEVRRNSHFVNDIFRAWLRQNGKVFPFNTRSHKGDYRLNIDVTEHYVNDETVDLLPCLGDCFRAVNVNGYPITPQRPSNTFVSHLERYLQNS